MRGQVLSVKVDVAVLAVALGYPAHALVYRHDLGGHRVKVKPCGILYPVALLNLGVLGFVYARTHFRKVDKRLFAVPSGFQQVIRLAVCLVIAYFAVLHDTEQARHFLFGGFLCFADSLADSPVDLYLVKPLLPADRLLVFKEIFVIGLDKLIKLWYTYSGNTSEVTSVTVKVICLGVQAQVYLNWCYFYVFKDIKSIMGFIYFSFFIIRKAFLNIKFSKIQFVFTLIN